MRTLFLCGLLLIPLPVPAQVWHELSPMPTPRYATATAVLNGYIYVIGGIGENDALLTTVEAYDPVRGVWIHKVPQLDKPRAYAAAVVLKDRLYLIGGLEGDTLAGAKATNDVLVFHPESGWKKVASLEGARYGLAAVVFKDQIYAIGGLSREAQFFNDRLNRQPAPLSTIEAYDPQQDRWETVARLPQAVAFASAALLGEDVYVIGGLSSNIPVTLIQRYRPSTGEAASLPVALPQEWWAGTALTYRDQILLIGGLGGARGTPLANVYALEFNSGSLAFRDLPGLLQARFSFAAASYNDTIFVFGGLNQPEGRPLDSAEAASASILTPRESPALPADFDLAPPTPHPFRERVTFTLSVSARRPDAPVQLVVYDLIGRPIARLLDRPLPPGRHVLSWNGTDAAGHPVPAGVYLVRLTQGPYHREHLLIRIR